MQTIYLLEYGWLTPIHLTAPYSKDAKRFMRLFFHNYRQEQTVASMARYLGVPRTTFRRIARQQL